MKKNVKTKIIFNIIIMGLMIVMTTIARAQSYTTLSSSNLTVNSSGIITSTSYSFSNKYITIPTIADGYTIRGIGRDAFRNKGIIRVNLPSTLRTIDAYAFSNNALTYITFPRDLTSIDRSAFSNNELTTASFSQSQVLTSIGDFAFAGNKLTGVSLPASLTSIGNYAFYNNQITHLSFPAILTSIGSYAFRANKLTSVSFAQPSHLEKIGSLTFAENLGLSEVVLPTRHTSPNFLYFRDTGGNPVTVIYQEDFSIPGEAYFAYTPYTLTSSDVTLDADGLITACSYDFEFTEIFVPQKINGVVVTGIGDGVFQNKGISSVVFPSSLISIGISSFSDNALTSVFFSVPSNVKSIGENAFLNNVSLTSVVLPTSHSKDNFLNYEDSDGVEVTSIEDFTKGYVTNFGPYTLTSSDVTLDADGLITACSYDFEFTDIIVPDEIDGVVVTGIGDGVFQNKGISSVVFPSGLVSVGVSSFSDNGLTSVSFPSGLVSVGVSSFSDNGLTSVLFSVPSNVKSIGENAFLNNVSLTSVALPTSHSKVNFLKYEDSDGVEVTSIEDFTKGYVANFGPYTLTSSDVTLDADGLITSCSYDFEFTDIIVPDEMDGVVVTGIGDGVFQNKGISSVVFPSGLVSVGVSSFSDNGLTSVVFPSGLVSVGVSSFSDNGLTSVLFSVPSNVKSIGENAFLNNVSLTSVVLPTSHSKDNFLNYEDSDGVEVTSIEDFTKGYVTNFGPYTLTSSDVTLDADGLITSCSYDFEFTDIIVPDEMDGVVVTGIGDGVFQNKGISSVVFPESLRSIGSQSFVSNGLTSVVFPSGLLSIGISSFSDNGLTSVLFSVPSNVKSIGENAFLNNVSLTSVVLPTSHSKVNFLNYEDSDGVEVTSIEDFTKGYVANFGPYTLTSSDVTLDADGLITSCSYDFEFTDIIVPDEMDGVVITGIGDGVFQNKGISSVVFPSGLVSVGVSSFSDNGLTSVLFPSGLLSIGISSFSDNGLTSVLFSVPSNVKSIGENAFLNNVSLTSVVLPTIHSKDNFLKYEDSDGVEVTSIEDFTKGYVANFGPYTLTSSDVTLDADGLITSCSYDFEFTDIIVPDEMDGVVVTGIGDGVFQNKGISSVVFPSGLVSVGISSFSDNGLTSVSFPSGLVSVGVSSFSDNGLTSVLFSVPSNVKSIGENAFLNNVSLTSVVLPTIHSKVNFLNYEDSDGVEVTSIEDFTKGYVANFSAYTLTSSDVTLDADGLITACSYDFEFTDIIVPDEMDGVVVTGIGDGVFQNKGISSVVFPSGLVSVGVSSFSDNGLTSVSFPSGLVSVGVSSFSDNGLTSVLFSVPSNVKSIGENAFLNNVSLTSVVLPTSHSKVNFLNYEDSDGVEVTSIEDFTKGYVANFSAYTLTSSDVTLDADGLITSCSYDFEFTDIIVPDEMDGVVVTGIGDGVFQNKGISSVVFPSGLVSVGVSSFSDNGLTSVSFPSGLLSIGISSFSDNGLTSVLFSVPSNVKSIGENAFLNNVSLTSVVLPTSHSKVNFLNYEDSDGVEVTSIEDFTKGYVANFSAYTLTSSDVTLDADGLITACSYDFEFTDIVVPDEMDGVVVTGIGDGVFQNKGISSVVFPSGLVSVGVSSFSDNGLTSVSFPSGLISIGISSFSDNDLTSVLFSVPSNVKSIGENAFLNNVSLTSVVLPTSHSKVNFLKYEDSDGVEVTSIEDFTKGYVANFSAYTLTSSDVTLDADGLITACSYDFEFTDIIVPDEMDGVVITGIGDGVFQNKGISSVVFPSGLVSVGVSSFSDNGLTSVSFPSGLVSVGVSSFSDNDLTSVLFSVPSNVKSIGENAFLNNVSLTSVVLPTSHSKVNFLKYEDSDGVEVTSIEDFTKGYVANFSAYTLTSSDVTLDADGLITACSYDFEFTDIIVPDEMDGVVVTGIGDGVFQNKGISSVVFPESLRSIGSQSFVSNGLTSVVFPSGLVSVGVSSFSDNGLTSVLFSVPSNVKSIGENAFLNNVSLTSVVLPTSHSKVNFLKYEDSDGVEVTSIEDFTKGYVANFGPYTLTSSDVTLDADGLITSCSYDFEFTDIIVPDEMDGVVITGIGDGVFQNKGISSVVFPESLRSIGSQSFVSNGLTSVSFPSGLLSIGISSFSDNGLTSVLFSVPSNVKSIGENAFLNNVSLTSVVLPTSHSKVNFLNYEDSDGVEVTSIEDFTKGYVANFGPYTLTSSDVTLDADGLITSCSYDFEFTDIIVPDEMDGVVITGIGDGVFQNKGISSVVFPESLRSIGSQSFVSNGLTSVVFPSGLLSIGISSFSDNGLTSVLFSVPSNVKSIGENAFLNNVSLTSVVLPTSHSKVNFLNYEDSDGVEVTSIEDFTKGYVANFSAYTLTSSDVTLDADGLITACSYDFEFTDIIVPDEMDGVVVTGIGDGVFQNKGISSVVFPSGLVSVGVSSFSDNGLTSVSFPSSLISIGISSFSDNGLTSVLFSVPSNVKSIGENAFLNNVSLTSVVLPTSHSKVNFLNYEDSDGVEITSIEDFTKGYVANFSAYTLTSSDVTLDADGLITSCSYDFEFTDIIVPDEMDGVVVTGIGDGVFQNKGISSVVFPSGLVSVGVSSFSDNGLTSVSFPSGLLSIGISSFSDNGLTSVLFSVPSNVKSIGENAFLNNVSLTSVVLPTSHSKVNFLNYEDSDGVEVTSIEDFTKGYVANFSAYTLTSSDVTLDADGLITACSYDFEFTDIIVPDEMDGVVVTGIGDGVFQNKGISSVVFPSGLVSVGVSSFSDNGLTSVSFPSGLLSIGISSFSDNGLTSVLFSVPSNVKSIGENAFLNNVSLTSVVLPTSHSKVNFLNYEDSDGVEVTSIEDFTKGYVANFSAYTLTSSDVTLDADGLITACSYDFEFTDIIVPDEMDGVVVTGIGDGVFQNKGISSVVFPSGLVSVGVSSFSDNGLTSVSFPSGLLSIGISSFSDNGLTSVLFSVPSNVKSIGENAFLNNVSLTSVVLPTSHSKDNFLNYEDSDGVEVTSIEDFTKGYVANFSAYTLTSSDVTLDADGLITACSYDFEFTDIIVPDEMDGVVVTGIGDGVFQNKGISSVVFPSGLVSVGVSSFSDNGLTSVSFPSGLVSVGVSSFSDNDLTSVLFSVPSNVKSIGENAFLNNVSLTSVVLPTSHSKVNFLKYEDSDGVEVTSIEDFTKGYVANFSAYTLTSSDVTLDADGLITACSYDFEFTDIIVPDEMDGVVVTGIGDGVFQNKGISSVVFPESLRSIGSQSFVSNGLTSVVFPSGLVSVGVSSFSDNGLTSVLFSVPSNVKSIGENAFLNNVSLTSVALPTSHSKVNFLNYEDSDGVEVTSIEDFTKGYVANFGPYTLTSSDVTLDADGLITSCSYDFEFTDIIVPDEMDGVVVTGIGDGVFQNKGISSVVFPESLRSIGSQSFFSNGLTSVSFPSGLLSIGISSFSDNGLTSVLFSVPSNVKSIGENAFLNNVSLTSVVLPTIHSKANFLNYEDSDGVEVTSIEDFTKGYVANFGPYTLTSSDVTLDADGLITSCSYDFEFTDIIVPDEMDGVVVTGIGDGVFQNKGISSVVFPSGLVSVGVSSFSDNGLTSVVFPSGLISIGISSFSDNGLTSVLFSVPSNVKSIGENAFLNNVSLTSVVLPTSHSKDNFLNYEDSDGVEVTSIEDFTKGYVANFGPYTLTSSDVTLDADGLITSCSYDFEFTDIIVPDEMDGVVITGIGDGVFQNKGISSVVFPSGLVSVGVSSFSDNGLTSVLFPSGLLSIGISSFSDNGLTSVLFSVPSNVKSIGENAFLNNVSLTSVVLPTIHSKDNFLKYEDSDGVEVTSIEDFTKGYVANFGPYTLTSSDVTLDADGLITSCSYDFEFTDIIVPDEMDGVVVTGIGDGVFQNKGISSVVFPSGLVSVGISSFSDNGLTSVSFPSGLVSVGVSSFSDNGLTSVLFSVPSNVKSIGENAFLNNVSLTSVVLPTIHSKVNFLNYEDSDGVEVTSIEDFTKGYVANFSAYTLTSSDVTLDADGLITACSYDFEFTDIIVPDEMDGVVVTGIGDGVFQNKGISSVVFPSGLVSVGVSSFSDNGLTSVSFPSGLVSVGVSSFSDNGLTSVLFSVPSNVKSIGENAFLNNVSLTSVVLPTSHSKVNFLNYEDSDGVEVTSIEDFTKGYVANFSAYTLTSSDVTLDADGLITSCSYDFEFTDIIVPDEMDGVVVTGIGDGVFQNKGISSVVFPSGLVSVGVSSFSDNGLTSVSFPSGLLSIGISSFSDNGLTSVLFSVPSNVKSIGENAFLNNVSLTSVVLPTSHSKVNFLNYEDSDGVEVTSIEDFTKGYVANFSAYTLTSSDVTLDADGLITSCSYDFEFTDIIVPDEMDGVVVTGIGDGVFQNKGISSVVFPSGLVSVGVSSFSDNGLTSVSFPSGLLSIGISSFSDNGLTSVLFSVPSNVKSIGENAFLNNVSLTSVVLPTSHSKVNFLNYEDSDGVEVTSIEDFTKGYVANFSAYTLTSSDVTLDADGLITACSYDFEFTDIIVPDEMDGVVVTGIGDGVFQNKGISSVVFPSGLVSVGVSSFSDNGLTSVSFPSGLISIGISSFSDNDLTSVLFSVPSNVKSIGENAFLNNVSLTSVVLPTSHSKDNFLKYEDSDGVEVTSIEDFTKGYVANFGPYTLTSSDVTLDADGLITSCSYDFEFTDIIVPDEMDGVVITGIGDGVFQNKGISSVVFPESLRSIGSQSFVSNGLTSVSFPSGLLSIGISSFSDNGLTSVLFSVPSNVKSIGENAFLNNVSLTSVVLPTSHSKDNFLKYEDSDGVEVTSIEDFTKGYVANFGPYTLTSSDVTLDADGLITACSYDFEFTDIIVPDEMDGVVVTGIGDGVFQNKGISSVVFPESLRSIGSQSFVSNGLTSVSFPSGLLSIGISSFSDNGLTSVLFSVPSNVKSIGENAFLNNVSLTSVVLPTSHSKDNFLKYEDSDGVEVTSIEDFTKGYVANFGPYTLTSSDVTLDADGLITACSYDFEFTDIIVPDEMDGVVVTGIGDGVFQNKGISSVVFPSGLVSVGVSSFSDNGLTSVSFPSGLISIGISSFSDNGLTSVLFSVPSNVKSIGENAFLNNVSLTSVVLPTSHSKVNFLNYEDSDGVEVTSIEDFTKGYVANFGPYTLTSSDVTLDADGLITSCSYDFEFTDIIVPDEMDGVVVTGIGDGVFQNKGISSVVFPESLRSIGSQSFVSNGLTSVVFPSGLLSIGISSFSDNGLTSVLFSVPSNVKSIGENAFLNNVSLTSVVLPTSHSKVNFLNYEDSDGVEVTSIEDFTKGYVANFSAYTLTSSDVTLDADGLITACSYDFEFTDIIVPDEMDGVVVTGIGDGVFQNKGISSVVFPSGLVSVGVSSFSDNGLTSVLFSVPSNVKSIGENAFLNNVSLTSVVLPTSHSKDNFLNYEDSDGVEVTSIEDFTKGYVANFSAYTLTSSDVTLDADGLITACSYDFEFTDIIVPDEMDGVVITGIGDGVFQNKGISSVVFPSGLLSIGISSFSDNGLTSVLFSVPSNVKSIGENAFLNNVSLTSVVLPTSHSKVLFLNYEDSDGVEVTSIEDFTKGYVANFAPYTLTSSDVTLDADGLITACSYDFEFTDIIVPDEMDGVVITGIGDGSTEGVFQNKGITSVAFPSGLTFIGKLSFQGNKLKSVVLPSDLLSVAYGAFHSNQLMNVILPLNLTSIGDWAFGNNNLTNVEFPSSLISIGDWAFGSNDLTNVEFPSSLSFIGEGTFSFNQLTNVEFSSGLTSIGDKAFAYNQLTSVEFPSVLTSIGNSAFKNNQLTSVEFPSSLTFIGESSFSFNKLISVSFSTEPSNLKMIDVNAFNTNDNLLEEIILPTSHKIDNFLYFQDSDGKNVTTIKDFSKAYVVKFESYTLNTLDLTVDENGVITACSYDFKFITDIIIPNEVDGVEITGIGDGSSSEGVFQGKGITSIEFPSSLESVGNQAFEDNDLKGVSFPSSLTTIGDDAFRNNKLTNVSFSTPSNLKMMGINAFSDNQGLSSLTLPSDNSNENFVGYLDSQGNKIESTEGNMYSITIFSLGYEVEIGEGGNTVLSLSDELNDDLMMAYPNPVQTMLTVERSSEFRGDVSLRMFNTLGKLVFSSSYSSVQKDMKVDFTTMPQGMYLLEVRDGAGIQIRTRIMKK